MMKRRLAAFVVLLGVLATLALAFGHAHAHGEARQSDGCVYCTGALASGPALPDLTRPATSCDARVWDRAPTPAPRFLLQLDHSGCAPPLA